jgi:alcohol dehydrogenase class IV
MFERKINIYEVFEVKGRGICYFGVGALKKMKDIAKELASQDIKRVLVVTGKSAYRTCGAWDVVVKCFNETGIEYIHYDGITPNPTVQEIDQAVKLGLEFGAQAVLGIGGGSPIDSAKAVAVLLEHPGVSAEKLFTGEFMPERAKPILAINTTHGTGTEVDRYAVASIVEKGYKPGIGFNFTYPLYSIDDPTLTTSLSYEQTLYTTVDALNHVIEASTSQLRNPYTVLLAKETVRIIAHYLPQALIKPDDLNARYWLLYASMLAGIAIDTSMTHLTHVLEHPLSALKPELAHGHGLGILLPSVLLEIYPAMPEILAEVLSPIVPDLLGIPGENEEVAFAVEGWLRNLGLRERLSEVGFYEEDVEKLTELAMSTPLLSQGLLNAPVKVNEGLIRNIYLNSL